MIFCRIRLFYSGFWVFFAFFRGCYKLWNVKLQQMRKMKEEKPSSVMVDGIFKWTEWLEAIGVCGGENSICHGGKVFLDKLFQTLFSDIKSLKWAKLAVVPGRKLKTLEWMVLTSSSWDGLFVTFSSQISAASLTNGTSPWSEHHFPIRSEISWDFMTTGL